MSSPGLSGFDLKWITKPFKDATDEWQASTRKATLYALRSTGRALAREAKRDAPVYPGAFNLSGDNDLRALAEAGNLKASIKNARRVYELGGGAYKLSVAPWGNLTSGATANRRTKANPTGLGTKTTKHAPAAMGQLRGVKLYRSNAEAIYQYMALAATGTETVITLEWERSLKKGWEKYR